MTRHAVGLAQNIDCVTVEKRNYLAVQFIRRTTVIFKIARGNLNIGSCRADRFARIARFDLR